MNEFKKQLAEQVYNRVEKELEVIRISQCITELIGVSPGDLKNYHEDPRIQVGDYDIVRTTRIFTQGWLHLWEIVQNNESYWNPSWSEFHGTATINIPPQHITIQVLKQLNNAKPLQLTPLEPKLSAYPYQQYGGCCLVALVIILIVILCPLFL